MVCSSRTVDTICWMWYNTVINWFGGTYEINTSVWLRNFAEYWYNIFVVLIDGAKQREDGQTAKAAPGEEKKVGRQEKPDDEKSEKTIANKESMS